MENLLVVITFLGDLVVPKRAQVLLVLGRCSAIVVLDGHSQLLRCTPLLVTRRRCVGVVVYVDVVWQRGIVVVKTGGRGRGRLTCIDSGGLVNLLREMLLHIAVRVFGSEISGALSEARRRIAGRIESQLLRLDVMMLCTRWREGLVGQDSGLVWGHLRGLDAPIKELSSRLICLRNQ